LYNDALVIDISGERLVMRKKVKREVLIIKLGITETIGTKVNWKGVSLGDIFRTTALLHLFKEDEVTWLTTKEGQPLLIGNPYISNLVVYSPKAVSKLKRKKFDIIINLEKARKILRLTNSITALKKYGFKLDERTGKTTAHKNSFEILANSEDPVLRRNMKDYWTKVLYNMVGAKWRGENYILGYKPRTKEIYDIGFNIFAKKRWPSKKWAISNWKKLENLIGGRYSISYQQSLNDVHKYIDWINSCRLLVTNDSLGLHLAIALKKKIIALFGPTSEKEVYLSNLGVALRPPLKLKCVPCFLTNCRYDKKCIDMINSELVYKNIKRLLGGRRIR